MYFRGLLAAVLCSMLANAPLEAQFFDRFVNPTVSVSLQHAPSPPLQVRTIAFGPPQGPCSDSVNDRVINDFHANGITLVDRAHLDTALGELDLQMTGLVDQGSAVRVGQMLGADALVFLKVRRCDISQRTTTGTCFNPQTKRSYACLTYHTDVEIDGNLRVIDLASGRVLAAKTYGGGASDSDRDGYPDSNGLLLQAEAMSTLAIHRMFLPWTEQKKLIFFNDKDCGLKPAAQLLRAGDAQGALDLSLANLEACRSNPGMKPKVQMHAYYNVGMAYFVLGDHAEAIRYFDQALRLGGGSIVTDSIAECRHAQQLASQMAQYEEDSEALLAELSAAPPATTDAPAAVAANQSSGQAPGSPVEERLLKLDTLLQKGLVTRDEYQQKRSEILSDL